MTDASRNETKREPFGRWVTGQRERSDWIEELAFAARGDRTFPKDGDPEAVLAHLRFQQAAGEVFQAVDDAESEWSIS